MSHGDAAASVGTAAAARDLGAFAWSKRGALHSAAQLIATSAAAATTSGDGGGGGVVPDEALMEIALFVQANRKLSAQKIEQSIRENYDVSLFRYLK